MGKVNRQCRRLEIALVALLALATLAIPMGTGYAAGATGELETLRNRALELVNKDRREHGLEPLKLEGELNQVAQSHSEDMRGRGYYAHESPEGDTVRDRYIEAGGSRSHIVAENIARCEGCPAPPTLNDVERLHRGWMDSPRHRKNILKRGLSQFGFGIIAEEYVMLAAQTFAGPGESRGLPPDEKRNPLSIEDVSERAVRLINGARERADVPLLKESEVLRQVARRLAPEKDLLEGSLKRETGLLDALEPGQRGRWRSISAVAGACSGCGAVPTASDLRWFLDQWLENPQHRSSLLESTLTHAGVWIAADGQGAKLAILVLGVIAAR